MSSRAPWVRSIRPSSAPTVSRADEGVSPFQCPEHLCRAEQAVRRLSLGQSVGVKGKPVAGAQDRRGLADLGVVEDAQQGAVLAELLG